VPIHRVGLTPGQPVFRPVDQRQIIAENRLTDGSVARIVKSRVRKLVRQRGKSETEADEFVALISGHSLDAHAGYATSAAARHARLPHPAAHVPQVGADGYGLHPRG
jgi:hypothetical protein